MAEQRYPIGIQSFPEIIEKGYTYIDKTQFIHPLIKHGKYIFLSRPRRFGKSLLLSTLKAYFEGRRDLFKGLAVDDMLLDRTPAPVLHFDFNNGLYEHAEGLLAKLHDALKEYEEQYRLHVGNKNRNEIPLRFKRLIRTIYEQTGRQVVILVDEYDKPLLGITDDAELFESNQRLLKSFYSNLKTMDDCIRFAFITGVARFSKVSIFSDFNNLNDISLENTFADICGWTEKELIETFRPSIEALAEDRGEDFDTSLKALRDYYDGYLFTPKGSRLYNPFSVLLALKSMDIEAYWFASGTPTFLVKRFRNLGIFPPDISGEKCSRDELLAVGLNDSNPIPLMFQTGYLTIGSYNKELDMYELRFPNREVEIGFYQNLLKIYAPVTDEVKSPFNFKNFKIDLYEGRPGDFMKRLNTLLKDLPGEDHCESAYRAITYLLAVLCGTRSIAEHHGYKGRSDIEVQTGRYVYLFEFKYNKSVREAMDQIRTRDYAGRFAMDSRTVYLIAANFNEKKDNRGLEYEILTLKDIKYFS